MCLTLKGSGWWSFFKERKDVINPKCVKINMKEIPSAYVILTARNFHMDPSHLNPYLPVGDRIPESFVILAGVCQVRSAGHASWGLAASSKKTVIGWDVSPQIHMLESWPQNMTVFGERFFYFFSSFIENITDVSHHINLRFTMCKFDTFLYCNMIPTIALTPPSYHIIAISFSCWEHLRTTVLATWKSIMQYYCWL